MRLRRTLLAAALVLTACTGSGDGASGTATPGTTAPRGSTPGSGTGGTTASTAPEGAPLEWTDFGDSGRVQTSSLLVPVDYEDPSKGTFDLYLARHLADPDQRIGTLLVNPGGPGLGGSDFAIYADQVYSKTLLARFDIVGWDPRGTGLSEPAIDCIDDYDPYFDGLDITPDTDAERQRSVDLAKQFADACVARSGDILAYVGTNESARDIDTIRRALGEERISYFGFSYGSELGTTWATMFPDTVRAIAVDGAADPNADLLTTALQQATGFERALDTFLARCSGDRSCTFHSKGDAEGAFDSLMASLDEEPIPTVDGRPDLTRAMALTGVSQALYSEADWPRLADALRDARDGDGQGLLDLFDEYYRRSPDGTWSNVLEAFQVISCQDSPERDTVAEDDADTARFRAVAPRTFPNTVGGYFCTFLPPSQDPRIEITGKGAGPILVMGTTGDPSTPIEASRNMAAALEDGRLVVVNAEGHTGYTTSRCATKAIDDYLVDPVANAPAEGATCP